MVVDDIRATLPALNCLILESEIVAVLVEERRRERKSSWCFQMTEVNPNEAVAIADLVGESFDLFGDGGHAAIMAKE